VLLSTNTHSPTPECHCEEYTYNGVSGVSQWVALHSAGYWLTPTIVYTNNHLF